MSIGSYVKVRMYHANLLYISPKLNQYTEHLYVKLHIIQLHTHIYNIQILLYSQNKTKTLGRSNKYNKQF